MTLLVTTLLYPISMWTIFKHYMNDIIWLFVFLYLIWCTLFHGLLCCPQNDAYFLYIKKFSFWHIPIILCTFIHWFLVDSIFGLLWIYTVSFIYKCAHNVVSLGQWILLLRVWAIFKHLLQLAYLCHTHQLYIGLLSAYPQQHGSTVLGNITLWFWFIVPCGFIPERVDSGLIIWWKIAIVYFSIHSLLLFSCFSSL